MDLFSLHRAIAGPSFMLASMLRYFDAHNHLQDDRLNAHRESLVGDMPALGLVQAIVAGSGEDDWLAVAALAEAYSWVRPSFGVHPWYVHEQSAQWREHLSEWLLCYPKAGVGEIGLDRWIPNADVPLQMLMFREQWGIASKMQRAATVHCLRAFGLLEEQIKTLPRLEHGFLLHSYGGPAEMVPSFVRLGAYFSASPYFLHERKAKQWATFAQVPLDRLLIETDAPDMWPPTALNPRPLQDEQGKELNHPANITLLYEHIAKLRCMDLQELSEQVEANFVRLFGAV
jgi:TatD DNase family protein